MCRKERPTIIRAQEVQVQNEASKTFAISFESLWYTGDIEDIMQKVKAGQ